MEGQAAALERVKQTMLTSRRLMLKVDRLGVEATCQAKCWVVLQACPVEAFVWCRPRRQESAQVYSEWAASLLPWGHAP